MPKHKKKFISKENSVTFHLVHRSQQDPLVTDETAPQRVLVPTKDKKKNAEDEHKYGIFFDDDYNYLQHLKTADEWQADWEPTEQKPRNSNKPKKVQLPSSVFASHVEESIGLLNKAAPESGLRLDLDPDIVAAMDDDFNFDDADNELEDNFIELANASGSDAEEDDSSDLEDDDENDMQSDFADEEHDQVGSLHDDFGEIETKSRFTDYSLSSSVIRRNEQLTLLDDRFEKMFESYEDGEIGALDCDHIEGTLNANDRCLLDMAKKFAADTDALGEATELKRKILTLAAKTDDREEMDEIEVPGEGDKWDCESILSTYSNIYNHPVKIPEPRGPRKIKIDRTGMPVDELEGRTGPKLTAKNLAELDGGDSGGGVAKSIISMVSELSQRPKGESPEERRLRKQNLREYRRERRKERKANTEAFKDEKVRQEKVMLNLRNNLRGIKIL